MSKYFKVMNVANKWLNKIYFPALTNVCLQLPGKPDSLDSSEFFAGT